ncbi:MAG: triose-phosphate isomerase, partial [Gammaproteobacteria bacterium]|nr:triose-phosphate isomerase [Gammaproteobacteria bacterium]
MTRQPIVAGNWKMHGNRADNQQLLQSINAGLHSERHTQVLVFPPFVYVEQVAGIIAEMNSGIGFGSQNMSAQVAGAFTGEISASMLTDLSCSHVLVGHSERRSLYLETDEQVADKFVTASSAGLTPILCIGESLEEREAGNTLQVVFRQIDAVVNKAGAEGVSKGIIAYEPVWAIGTGKTASPQQAQDVHNEIRAHLKKVDETLASSIQILYGGSVNATNAAELFAMEDIDG